LQNPEEYKTFEIQLKNIKTKHINIMEERSKPLTESNNKNSVIKKEEVKL